jgi:hypothetical protein
MGNSRAKPMLSRDLEIAGRMRIRPISALAEARVQLH